MELKREYPKLLTTLEAADFLGVSDRTVWALSAPRGPIPCVRIGHSVRYRLADLEAYVESCVEGGEK